MTPGPQTDNQICPNQPYGQHIIVRCKGCNSLHSTKNIGWRNEETKEVSLARSLFDIVGTFCLCKDPSEAPLIHDCKIDDNIEYRWFKREKPIHQVKSQGAKEVVLGWWKKFALERMGKEATDDDLKELVEEVS